MTEGIYHWEIFDTMSGLVVSKGIGEKEGRKTLSYLRSVYGCHLNIRPVGGEENPDADWREMYDFYESVSWPDDDMKENAVTEQERETYPAMFVDTDKDGIPDIDDPSPYVFREGEKAIEKDILLSEEATRIMDVRREYDKLRLEHEAKIKDKHPDWDVSSRLKTLYSILSKLRKTRMTNDPQKKYWKGLKDIAGIRIVAEDYADLLKIERELNALYGDELKRDDNFYKKPKKGYRALHFTIKYKSEWPIEIQLSTKRQRKLSKVCHPLMKASEKSEGKTKFDAEEMNRLSKIAAKADRGHAKSQAFIDKLTDEDIHIRLAGGPTIMKSNPKMKHRQVKNPTILADTLDAFFQEPMSTTLKEKERIYLKKIQKKLRTGEHLSRGEFAFLGDAMNLLMVKGVLSSVVTPPGLMSGGFAKANPEQERGAIRRIGRVGERETFPVWFEGRAEGERPVMFDIAFRDRPEMRVGQTIQYQFHETRGGWKIVRSDCQVSVAPTGQPTTAPATVQMGELTSEFTTGYITKPRGAEEGEQPYRMAWAARGEALIGSIPGMSGLKIPEDVIDTFNEPNIAAGRPRIMPSYGRIVVTGYRNGRIFVVRVIDNFVPQTEERSITVPLSELQYELNAVTFDKNDHVGTINNNLGFDSHPSLNAIKSKFDGSITIHGSFKKEGFWNRMGEHNYYYYLGNTAEWTPSVIEDLKRVIRTELATQRIQELVQRYYREGRAINIEHLRGEIQTIYDDVYGQGTRAVTTTEAEGSLVTRRTDYEMEYIELLKGLQREMNGEYLYIPTSEGEPEFLFVINDMLILEIPVTNKASYIFRLDHDKGIEQQAADIRAVPQRSAIYLSPEIGQELKYVGRVIHRTPDGWIDRMKVVVRAQSTGRENPKDEADTTLADELILYATNDSDTYHQWIQPIIRNLAHHTVKQEFDRELAIKSFSNLAKPIQKKYWLAYNSSTPPTMNEATKLAIGLGLYESAEEEIRNVVQEILMGMRTRRGERIERPNPNVKVVRLKYVPPSMVGD